MGHPDNVYSLVADVGGTNTRVALAEGVNVLTNSIRKYRNAEFGDLESVLRAYVSEEGNVDCRGAAVAVAGPVTNGRGRLTNRDWDFDEATVAQATRAETVAVINDLQAQGHAIGRISEDNLKSVFPGSQTGSTSLVIGVGTGFNIAPVFDDTTPRLVAPSEAGHIALPAQSDADIRLSQFLTTKEGFASVEDVLSGRGVENTYAWVTSEAGSQEYKSAADIMAGLVDGIDPMSEAVARQLVRTFGIVAGNLALVHLPFDGIYLIGGVSRALAPHFDDFGFAEAFCDKGRFADFMQSFPIFVVEDDYAALTGLAAHLKDLL